MSPIAIPSLAELLEHPERARELPPAAAADLLVRVVGLQIVLLIRALGAPADRNGQGRSAQPAPTLAESDTRGVQRPLPDARPLRARNSLLSAKEAAKMLSCTEAAVRKWIYQRRLPTVKVGRLTRVRLADLEALVVRGLRRARSIATKPNATA